MVVIVTTVLLLVAAHGRSTYSNNYVLLGDAIRHGHLWIDWPGRIIDAALWRGHRYVIDGPFPVLFVLPLVAIFGPAANQTTIAIAGGIIATALGWTLLYTLGVPRVSRLYLVLFLFAGSQLWWCAQLGDVTFLAHVCAVCLTFAALLECFGARRGWLIGLYAVCAIESRFPMVMALPMYAYIVWAQSNKNLRSFVVVVFCGLAFWIGMNEAMWGLPYDIGHTLFYHEDAYGNPQGSPFGLRYLPYQLYSYFFRAPEFVEWLQVTQWPYIRCNPHGIALTFVSPALLLACLAREPRYIVWPLWITVVLVAGPDMLYYIDGFYTFGMRHALDFEPFLLVLMALAVREKGLPTWGKVLCVWSALVGIWGIWFWGTFYRTGN